jgi:hypothetical protein
VYNDAVVRQSTELVNIIDCFTEDFDYREVMNSYFPTTEAQDGLDND